MSVKRKRSGIPPRGVLPPSQKHMEWATRALKHTQIHVCPDCRYLLETKVAILMDNAVKEALSAAGIPHTVREKRRK